ncbi:MAG: type I-E CRISPR-associated protein Cse2/CasB [Syntrophales bacterium]|jgi:CRISPR system Cascade subunit CasB|nr:type I-E CRISPR-associated protein Cse2/CasB [Syntrophales bacterium]MCK9528314.1 type I-E CRISPR-associated protein Cse2/CasB [Syntrophales bacterium]MDX9922153.1 type I-E CRISPR-associated protein Cse2/CasB [Syntrophales bacterium]
MATTYLRFNADSAETQALSLWWQALDASRGDRAELRRCATLTEVVLTPSYHRLRIAVGKHGAVNDNALALVAGLAARVKMDVTESTLAEQMATGKADGSARVSGLRFRRLLKVKEAEGLFSAMGRVVTLLGGAVNLQSLANSVYFWNDKTRKQWAFEYYSKSPSEQ